MDADSLRSAGEATDPIKISIIGCPFQTTYGDYIAALRQGLEPLVGASVQWVSTNCGCGDPVEIARQFHSGDRDHFELPTVVAGFNIVGYSASPLKRALKTGVRSLGADLRATRFAQLSRDADVIHLQQTLGAFGSDSAFRLLQRPIAAARVITLHELDPEQTDFPQRNPIYNLADALIVHDSLLKARLASLNVDPDRIHVVCCGTDLAEHVDPAPRDGIVFYGGHNLNKSKGLETLFRAYRALRATSATPPPRLRIHGHYGEAPPPEAIRLAEHVGIASDIDWLNSLSLDDTARLYRRSQVCVLPYTGSFAGLPAGIAAANRLPIIATRFAGIPDHIGDLGVRIAGDDPAELAEKLKTLLADEAVQRAQGEQLRAHAERRLGWASVARDTLAVYRAAQRQAMRRSLQTAPAGRRA